MSDEQPRKWTHDMVIEFGKEQYWRGHEHGRTEAADEGLELAIREERRGERIGFQIALQMIDESPDITTARLRIIAQLELAQKREEASRSVLRGHGARPERG